MTTREGVYVALGAGAVAIIVYFLMREKPQAPKEPEYSVPTNNTSSALPALSGVPEFNGGGGGASGSY